MVAAGVVGVAALVFALLRPEPYAISADRRLSTLRTTPDGAGALYVMLEELGIPVERRQTPLADAGPVEGFVALLEPTRRLTPREVAALFARVEAGGTLLYVPAVGDGVVDSLPVRPTRAWTVLGEDAPWPGTAEGRVRIRQRADGEPGPEWGVVEALDAAPRAHRWTRPSDTLRAVERFLVAREGAAPAGSPLVARNDTLIAVHELSRGRGRIVLVSDPVLLSNGGIASGGAAPLIARIAAEVAATSGPLTFDEYHHDGSPRGLRHGVARFLGQRPAGHVLLQLAVVGAVALLALSWRFGAPLPPPSATRRSPLEHVETLAGTYREARARKVPRLLLVAGLARRLGRPRPRDESEVAGLLARLVAGGRVDGRAVRGLEAALADSEGIASVAHAVDHILDERT